jgi:hypothetical protein
VSNRNEERMAAELMTSFAERTGLTSDRAPRRYLWTDAFAVCNFLGLAGTAGDVRQRDLAQRLVAQVHSVLGRHRSDDSRSGWLSGLDGEEAAAHPTRGGLRIGKELPERRPDEPFDERLEWDRDGQYFHYLTKWMHALDQLTHGTGGGDGNRWARELAEAAHAAFTYVPAPGGRKRMYWKMSIDLSRPLVPSMGHHDPLDGLITYEQLRVRRPAAAAGPGLEAEISDLGSMCRGMDWATEDPLGLGGLLTAAHRIEQLVRLFTHQDRGLLATVLDAAARGLSVFAARAALDGPASGRLGFRELGLSIGLRAVERMRTAMARDPKPFDADPRARSRLEQLANHLPLRATIESFWLEPEHQRSATWIEHQDINEVMLATSLAPDGYLALAR